MNTFELQWALGGKPQSSNVKRTGEKSSEDDLVFVPTDPGFTSKQRDLPQDSAPHGKYQQIIARFFIRHFYSRKKLCDCDYKKNTCQKLDLSKIFRYFYIFVIFWKTALTIWLKKSLRWYLFSQLWSYHRNFTVIDYLETGFYKFIQTFLNPNIRNISKRGFRGC